MSLEQIMEANTAAVVALDSNIKALLAQMQAGGAPAASTDTKATDKPKADKKDKAPVVSFDEMKAALLKVKGDKGADAAKALIKDVGGAAEMAKIDKSKFAAVLAACEAALATADEPAAEDDGL